MTDHQHQNALSDRYRMNHAAGKNAETSCCLVSRVSQAFVQSSIQLGGQDRFGFAGMMCETH